LGRLARRLRDTPEPGARVPRALHPRREQAPLASNPLSSFHILPTFQDRTPPQRVGWLVGPKGLVGSFHRTNQPVGDPGPTNLVVHFESLVPLQSSQTHVSTASRRPSPRAPGAWPGASRSSPTHRSASPSPESVVPGSTIFFRQASPEFFCVQAWPSVLTHLGLYSDCISERGCWCEGFCFSRPGLILQ